MDVYAISEQNGQAMHLCMHAHMISFLHILRNLDIKEGKISFFGGNVTTYPSFLIEGLTDGREPLRGPLHPVDPHPEPDDQGRDRREDVLAVL